MEKDRTAQYKKTKKEGSIVKERLKDYFFCKDDNSQAKKHIKRKINLKRYMLLITEKGMIVAAKPTHGSEIRRLFYLKEDRFLPPLNHSAGIILNFFSFKKTKN